MVQYEIVLGARLGPVGRCVCGFEVTDVGPRATRLRGWTRDRSALQGLLNELGDGGYELLSLERVDPHECGRD
jgi:hypothetical protein